MVGFFFLSLEEVSILILHSISCYISLASIPYKVHCTPNAHDVVKHRERHQTCICNPLKVWQATQSIIFMWEILPLGTLRIWGFAKSRPEGPWPGGPAAHNPWQNSTLDRGMWTMKRAAKCALGRRPLDHGPAFSKTSGICTNGEPMDSRACTLQHFFAEMQWWGKSWWGLFFIGSDS